MTDAQLDEAEHESTSLAQRKSDVMSAVRKVIRGDSRKIWVLVAALEKFPASCLIARRMRKELNDGTDRIDDHCTCCIATVEQLISKCCFIQPNYNLLMQTHQPMLYLQMQQLEVTLVFCKPASVIFRLHYSHTLSCCSNGCAYARGVPRRF